MLEIITTGEDGKCPDYFPLTGGSFFIPDDEFDNLFIVTVPRFFGVTKIVKARYHAP